jgi:hypothetical protein
MKNYSNAVEQAGMGRTPQLCQDALVEMLEELFQGKDYTSPAGRRSLRIIRQDIPIPEDDDEDVDTEESAVPYVRVAMNGGEIPDDDSPQMVEFSLTICAYDGGTQREGMRDVANIKEDIIQRVCTKPYFGGVFTILKPIAWALQQDPSPPYYFGAIILTCTAPAMTQDAALKSMI